jgi:hypothetical protein
MKAAAIISLLVAIILGLLCAGQLTGNFGYHNGSDWVFTMIGCGAFLVASFALFARDKESKYLVLTLDDLLNAVEKNRGAQSEPASTTAKKG